MTLLQTQRTVSARPHPHDYYGPTRKRGQLPPPQSSRKLHLILINRAVSLVDYDKVEVPGEATNTIIHLVDQAYHSRVCGDIHAAFLIAVRYQNLSQMRAI